ncbi:DNA replication/repair protein RecF [Acetohalobium arabaticum]|uniref:DNA replication and repair protein RecF n=1 Tax=Acetohalobium arabaticum (strain ATCC 49924 / DSM 5501 / Z-7288) TaxID=574087 RepID=D9QSA0_ACEAZ|nr:DNA replication/repair protein RecF [Acetohalobium arabaticum]ADL11556.1 DNA replication and repair protein RecF [Acetohalobium arabaticum DSM 5501]
MYLTNLFLKNFRNYHTLELKLNRNLNIFIGDNAEGKTNILEAIYLLSTGDSHRTNITSEMVNWQQDSFYISSLVNRKEQEFKIEFLFKNRKKEVKINDNKLQKLEDLLGYINAIIFSPEDLELVKGSPSKRRKFINLEISQVNSYYYHNLQEYRRIVKQRNNLLKEIREGKSSKDMLVVWNQQLIELGSKIITKRLNALDKLSILARLMHRKITDGLETLELSYQSSLDLNGNNSTTEEIETVFTKKLKANQQKEIDRGVSIFGPHRDDIIFEINDINTRKFGSQGQQRTAALALKLAELEFMKSEIGEYPILLLDDVFSELDNNRQQYLLKVIENRIQTFITSTEINRLHKLEKNKNIYQVKGGKVMKTKYDG